MSDGRTVPPREERGERREERGERREAQAGMLMREVSGVTCSSKSDQLCKPAAAISSSTTTVIGPYCPALAVTCSVTREPQRGPVCTTI